MGKSGRYILKGKEPVPCENLFEWAKWLETGNRNVTFDVLPDGTEISTVFLGLDHRYGRWNEEDKEGYRPLIFETMVIGGEYDGYIDRYETWDEAAKGHHAIIAMVLHAEIKEEE